MFLHSIWEVNLPEQHQALHYFSSMRHIIPFLLPYIAFFCLLTIAYTKYWYKDSIHRDSIYHLYSWQTIHPFIRMVSSSNLSTATSTLNFIKIVWFTENWTNQNLYLGNQKFFWDTYNGGVIFRMQNNPILNAFTQHSRATSDSMLCI